MDSNLLAIIKREKEDRKEDKNDNSSRLSFFDVHVKVENDFDDCLQNSVLLNNQQETFNYDNFKEEKQSCSICSENFINSYSLYKHNLIHLEVPLVRRKLFICDVCSNFYKTKKQLQHHITTAHEDKTLYTVITVQCPKCPKILNKSILTTHLKQCHSEGTFQCKICKSVKKSKDYLLTHMRRVHDDDGMLHICDICGKSFKSPSKLKRHKKYSHTHQEGMTIQCPKCPKILNKSILTTHLKQCHSEGTFQCKICKSVKKSKQYLLGHMRRVHDDDGMLHSCDICGKSFKSPSKVKRHKKRSHTHQEGMTVQCPKCPKILNKSILTTHLKQCHSEGTFQCKICKSVKKSKDYLLTHMRRVHDDDGMLHICDICGKSFKSPSKLKRHKKYSHTHREGMTVQCPKCPKILNKSILTTHLKQSHSEGTFQCKICKSVLKSEPSLVAHMKEVHYDDGMLHHCDICGKSFKSPSKVKRHKKRSHTYQELITVPCPKCPKILNKSALTKHLKNCHSEGTFQCKICKSVFKSKRYLSTHMRMVHDDDGKLHHCDICGKSFKWPTTVKRHKKKFHTHQESSMSKMLKNINP